MRRAARLGEDREDVLERLLELRHELGAGEMLLRVPAEASARSTAGFKRIVY
jgi:hypothetical protein